MTILKSQLIVNNPKYLNECWAQNIVNLQQSSKLTNKIINKVEIASVDIGTTTRVRLNVKHEIPDVPKQWFVKLPSLSWRAKAITTLPRLLPTEVRFYNELAPQVPLTKPRILAARSRLVRGSTLVMADVSEFGAIPGKAGESLTAEQARAVVEQLAHFHLTMADKAQQDRRLRWLAGPIRQLEDALGTALAVPLMKRGLRLAGEAIDQSLHAGALTYAENRRYVMRFLSKTAPTLVHHDCHPGNLFWQDGQPGFWDWQMVRIGEGIGDVSYFMATALEPELRRQIETDLLLRYHTIVAERKQWKTGFKHLFQRYRAHLSYPFEAMVVTLAVGGLMQLDSNLEMIKRSAVAVTDHDSFGILADI